MTISWKTTGTGGVWSSSGNWSGLSGETYAGQNPANLDNVTLGSSNSNAYTITDDLGSVVTLGSLSVFGGNGTGHTTTLLLASATPNASASINAASITLGHNTILDGAGTVSGTISGAGVIDATGGLLDITGNLLSNALNLEVGSPSSTLELGGTVVLGTKFTFLNTGNVYAGELQLGAGAQASFETNGVVAGMHVQHGVGAPSEFIDLSGVAPSLFASSKIVNGTTIELLNLGSAVGAHFSLSSAAAAGTFVDWRSDGSGGTEIFLSDTVCFAAGTRILTDAGEVAVEHLAPGSTVLTVSGNERIARPVTWIGRRRIDLAAHPRPHTVAPICIRAGAVAEHQPTRDLLVSPDHAIFVDGVLIAARQLVNGMTIVQEAGRTAVEYFHIELDGHAILLAENLPAESYIDTGNRNFFSNAGEPLMLHPDLTEDRSALSRAARACAPFVVSEAAVRPVWQRLADRAAALGHIAPALVTTTDPALRIVSKGRTIEPIYGQHGLYIFPLPLGATGVRIVSRAASPAATQPWLDDRRELGVAVARIVLRTASDTTEIPVDHPDLVEGWWGAERESAQHMHRWTNGSALLALPVADGHCMLELHLRGTASYPADAPAAAALQRRAG